MLKLLSVSDNSRKYLRTSSPTMILASAEFEAYRSDYHIFALVRQRFGINCQTAVFVTKRDVGEISVADDHHL